MFVIYYAPNIEVEDFWKITDHFRGIYRIYPNSIKETQRMSTSNRLDLRALGFQLVTTKPLPDHCSKYGPKSVSYFAHLEFDLNLIDL